MYSVFNSDIAKSHVFISKKILLFILHKLLSELQCK